jgi:sulfite oxidase
VRNHGGVPEIDEDAYFFDVGGLVNNPRRITLRELKDEAIFPRQTNVVTLQCSGTRRIEQIQQYPGDGDELINAPVRPNLSYLILMVVTTTTTKEKTDS